VTVPLSGQSQLQLVVTTAGDNFFGDHADWAGAHFVCAPVNTNSAPIPTITSPAPSLAYKVGDVVNYVGSATDAEDGPIPGASLSWSIVIHHCPGGTCHNHFLLNTTGASGSFTVPDHGDESHFELVLTATDSVGATASTSVTILPMTVQITLQTSPTGLIVVYGALTGTAPMTRTSIVGSMQTISTLSPQNGLTFSTWSDGGAQQHNILVGQTSAVFTATFATSAPPGTLQLSGATYSVGENGGSATITVRRTGGSAGAVGVSLATSNGTATAGADYTAVTQTVTFANGESGDKPVSVPILEDTAVEGNETVNLTLSNPTGGAALGSPSAAVLTITDNDLTLTVTKNGNGTVTSTPMGINCGADCSEVYTSGAVVTLTATPGRNRVFAGWSGGGCTGTGSCTVTMDANKTVRATFRNQ
jgi:Calx-beta domain/Divergent InlB B-repeat domain/NPCBM/NEW2 domain